MMTGIDRELQAAQQAAQNPQAQSSSAHSISVDIYDQIYRLRGTDPAYIEHLASLVDAKMRAVSAQGGTVDSLRVAVLAALNITDELEALRERYNTLARTISQSQTAMRSRSASISGMLDEVLDQGRDQGREEPIRRAG